MRDYMDRRVTSSRRVTSTAWDPPTPCKQVLRPFGHDFSSCTGLIVRSGGGGEGVRPGRETCESSFANNPILKLKMAMKR